LAIEELHELKEMVLMELNARNLDHSANHGIELFT